MIQNDCLYFKFVIYYLKLIILIPCTWVTFDSFKIYLLQFSKLLNEATNMNDTNPFSQLWDRAIRHPILISYCFNHG